MHPADSMPPDIATRLNALSREFGASLGERVAEVRTLWGQTVRAASVVEAQGLIARIHDVAHALAGSGKSFGYPQVSQAGAPLDGLLRVLAEKDSLLTPDEIAQIDVLVRDLEHAAHLPGEPVVLEGMTQAAAAGAAEDQSMHVLMVAPAGGDAHETLVNAIRNYGYGCTRVTSMADVPESIRDGRAPAAIFADVSKSDTHLRQLRKDERLGRLPLIVASPHASFEDRLRAVRFGAMLYVATPLDPHDVVKLITSIEEAQTQRSYRVVVVEDETTLGQFYQMVLEHAGMDVRIVSAPEKLLDTMSGFDPDIVVMDVYMEGCTGLELAQIVRQFPAYTTVPILFLSTESRLDLQLQARHLGGDDFLVKPLQPAQLVSAVMSRSNRYRDLKKLTDRDSLTGLLNHTNILRNLEREISIAARTKAPLSFCMIDIDHFKKVNDTHGHVVGDQVLVRVTHLLRNRLRRTDYIGRYGGEEFAIVMPNTDAQIARAVLDNLRVAGNELEHQGATGIFRVTFSGGVATYPAFADALALTEAADDALYQAKHGGRNRVVIAAPK